MAKYNEFNDDIVYYKWHKNEYDGYILRELINEKTMFRLTLSSNSSFSTKFKRDVSDILVKMREHGEIEITNEKLVKKKKSQTYDDKCNRLTHQHHILSYDSIKDMMYVQKLIAEGARFPISKYLNKHVLYAFIIPIETVPDHGYVVIKFGYSEDIIDRFKTLQSEYKSKIFFLKAKLINGKKDETKFHDMLRTTHGELIENYSYNGKEKTKLYKLSPVLMMAFDNYLNNSQINELEPKLCMEYLMAKENNFHQKIMQEKDIELAKIQNNREILKYQHIDKMIELERLVTEGEANRLERERLAHTHKKKSPPKKREIIRLCDDD
jgi:hypothetical protein